MIQKVASLGKSFITKRALIWLLARVIPFMDILASFLVEALATKTTWKGFLSHMSPHVNCERVSVAARKVTHCTLVGLFSCMNSLMIISFSWAIEFPWAK